MAVWYAIERASDQRHLAIAEVNAVDANLSPWWSVLLFSYAQIPPLVQDQEVSLNDFPLTDIFINPTHITFPHPQDRRYIALVGTCKFVVSAFDKLQLDFEENCRFEDGLTTRNLIALTPVHYSDFSEVTGFLVDVNMATPTDLQSILAALASGAGATPQPTQPQQGYAPPPLPQGVPHGYGGYPPQSATPAGMPPYGLPAPSGAGSFNLNDVKPSAAGSIDLNSLKPAQVGSLDAYGRPDSRMPQGYGRSRTRSRSPPRNMNNGYSANPYRDERRGGGYNGYGNERPRSRSPSRRNDNFSPAMGRGRERSPPRRAGNEDSEIITMDPSVVGLVIGRQGENLKRIEKTTGCKIQFITGPEGGSTRRQCRIDGPFRAREDAKREIYRTIDENERGKQQQQYGGGNTNSRGSGGAYSTQSAEMPELRPGELAQQMMVPDKTVGLIIGRGGETIRDLQEKSACHINIVGENKSVGGLRPVNLIGTPQAADHAKALIMEIVASDERPNQQQQQQQAMGGRPPMGAPAYGAPPQDAGKINESIHVPSEAVGMIIGKGGETIKNMQNDTGCKINVSQPSGPDYEREIGLIGTRQAIEAAKRAIWDKVDTVREKSGGGNPRGGNRRDDGGAGFDRYSQPQQQQSYGQQPAAQASSMPPGGAPAGGDDPYAPWGGYSGYVAWYYQNMLQQGNAPGGPPAAGGPTRPPGA